MIIQSLVEGPARSDGRLQPGDEQEGVAIINTANFKVRKRSGRTTLPVTSPTKCSATRKGEAVAMDTSLERRVELADVGKSVHKEEKQPLSVTGRIQFPGVIGGRDYKGNSW